MVWDGGGAELAGELPLGNPPLLPGGSPYDQRAGSGLKSSGGLRLEPTVLAFTVFWMSPAHTRAPCPARRTFFFCFVPASLAFLFFLGCANHGPAPKSALVAPAQPPPVSETGYYAACSGASPGGHSGPWTGPLRSSEGQAEQDAEEHNKSYRGHNALILHY